MGIAKLQFSGTCSFAAITNCNYALGKPFNTQGNKTNVPKVGVNIVFSVSISTYLVHHTHKFYLIAKKAGSNFARAM